MFHVLSTLIAKMYACGFADVFPSCIFAFVNIISSHLGIRLCDLGNTLVSYKIVFWKGQHCANPPTASSEGIYPAHTSCHRGRPRKPCLVLGAPHPLSINDWLWPRHLNQRYTIHRLVRELQSALEEGLDQSDSLLGP